MKKLYDPQAEDRERAILVQVVLGKHNRQSMDDSLVELERLSDTAGARVMGRITQRRARPTSTFFIGEGKLSDIEMACRKSDANLVIFDNELSAIQVNNLDLSLNIKVIDRTELILQIFARRARSAEAKVQVELAQLQYLVSRIPISAKQQRFQGGIGMRGPGESPFKLRNEPMRKRIRDLKRKLSGIQKRRRRTRVRRPWPLVSLVGYTNAGKSTLLNAFTAANAYVDDRLFATLDTKTRLVDLPDRKKSLITDTVGFIRNLPHGLIASFRSTLEEVSESDLLLIVADASHPCVNEHVQIVLDTLDEIGATDVPSLLVLNKCDMDTDPDSIADLIAQFPGAIKVSARKKTGLEDLRTAIARLV